MVGRVARFVSSGASAVLTATVQDAPAPPPLSDEEIVAFRQRMVRLLARRYPADADDLAQELAATIAGDRDRFTTRVREFDHHVGYFVSMALTRYRMQLRSTRRRKLREERFSRGRPPTPGIDTESYEAADVVEVLEKVELTPLQRDYVEAVLVGHRSIAQIAADARTSERAVRATLARAAKLLRDYLEDRP